MYTGVPHNETSTGATSQIAKLRAAIDSAKHPALLKEFIWSGYLRFNFIYFQMLAYTSFTLTISASYIE